MKPEIYKIDQVAPLIIDRAGLHEMAVAYAVEEFDRRGECEPMWLIAAHHRIVWMNSRWENDFEKDLTIRLIRTLMKTIRAHAYCFICEAYVASYTPGTDERLLPSEMPKDKREEVLFVNSADRQGESGWTRFLITHRQSGSFLGPRADEDMKAADWTGRMFNLFG